MKWRLIGTFALLLFSVTSRAQSSVNAYDRSWKGFVNGKIAVFIHYTQYGNILRGEITYLNRSTANPLTLLGKRIDSSFILYEYMPDGMITGMITGRQTGNDFTGVWSKPGSDHNYKIHMVTYDTLINTTTLDVNPDSIYGQYYYQYGQKGYQGELTLKHAAEGKAILRLWSVTSAPARNIADIGEDTVSVKDKTVVYQIPGSDSCIIQIQFFKSFAAVSYLRNGGCNDMFGANASVKGLFYKIKIATDSIK